MDEALKIQEEDKAICRKMGFNGAELLEDGMTVLTHCNAGGLATADFGTALGVIYAAQEQGKKIRCVCRRNTASSAGGEADGVGVDEERCRDDAHM